MKRSVLIIPIALVGSIAAQAANAQPIHHPRSTGCRQHAVLVSSAPALVQQIMNPFLNDPRIRCMPVSHDAPDDIAWPINSPSIAPSP
jgi:hypothetical protein